MREEGAAWARSQSTRGFFQLEAAVRASSPCHVVRSGWEYLEQQGLCPGSTGDAYRVLASFLADERLEATPADESGARGGLPAAAPTGPAVNEGDGGTADSHATSGLTR